MLLNALYLTYIFWWFMIEFKDVELITKRGFIYMNKIFEYDYTELHNKIIEDYGSVSKFSKAMGCKKSTMSYRLRNMVEWQQDDVYKACMLLMIPKKEIGTYFYSVKVQGD